MSFVLWVFFVPDAFALCFENTILSLFALCFSAKPVFLHALKTQSNFLKILLLIDGAWLALVHRRWVQWPKKCPWNKNSGAVSEAGGAQFSIIFSSLRFFIVSPERWEFQGVRFTPMMGWNSLKSHGSQWSLEVWNEVALCFCCCCFFPPDVLMFHYYWRIWPPNDLRFAEISACVQK